MSEISGGSDDGIEIGSTGEVSSGSSENEAVSSVETVASTETAALSASAETIGGNSVESVSAINNEMIAINPNEVPQGINQILVTQEMLQAPPTMEQAQKDVESYHQQSISQILAMNGRYMSEADRSRVSSGVDSIRAVQYDPFAGRTGGYMLSNGKSSIEVSVIDRQQMERSTKHETNHFASTNREIIVPQPDKKGYTVYKTVGTRQTSWFHSNETGQNSDFTSKGRGLNEGLTTMYTNQQLTELSKEKGKAAEREAIYPHATEICGQLENIVGKDALKEAYYGGNIQGLEEKVDSLAGEKEFEALRDCLDRAISEDPAVRVQAMKEAQDILDKMYEEGGKKA